MSTEDSRVNTVRIVSQRALAYEQTPFGYDLPHRMDVLKAITYYPELQNSINGINPDILPGRIDGYQFNKSLSNLFAVNTNVMIWDDVPELENLPVANDPSSMQQQYVSVPVRATTYQQIADTIRRTPNATPAANGIATATNKALNLVYQVPASQLASIQAQAGNGSNFFKWLWTAIKGGSNG
jgi:hypothetical protein